MDKINDIYILAAWPTIDVAEANVTALAWKKQGYRTAVLIDNTVRPLDAKNIDYILPIVEWKGFPNAANELCQMSFDIIVIAGNDMFPDAEHHAQVIGKQFTDHFGGTNGVMQPTGDNYGCIDIAAVSPWIGKDYIAHCQGQPYCEDYYHYYCDADLQTEATKKGVFWQRPDLVQYHDHWSRKDNIRPVHLERAKDQHQQDKATYTRRHGAIV